MYSKEIVEKNALAYFGGDSLAANVWIDKYCLKNTMGEFMEDSPDMMHKRLAKEFARIEGKYSNSISEEEIYELFKDYKYIVPQGRVAAGLGALESYRSLSNCLVLPPPKDSYSSIMYTDTMLVNAAKRGCGYGIDLSYLRPKNSTTQNAAATSTGIIPFMERYSNSTREVGQEGRRGACLLGININHPQSLDFATAKIDKTKITGANISLKIDDKFFQAVENSEYYSLEFNGRVYEDVKAPEYWSKIIKQVKGDSEPGIFMWDTINNYDPVSVYKNHRIVLTNACGEQPMGEYDSCRLLVSNLYSFVDYPFTPMACVNFEKLFKYSKILLRLGDDLVDLEIEYIDRIIDKINSDPEPIEEKAIELALWNNIKDKAISGRRVGCGITGLGDMLAACNIQYGSVESFELVEKVMHTKLLAELEEGMLLAEERGAFPDYNAELENNGNSFYIFLEKTFPQFKSFKRRNINWSTIAPTGTTSLMTQTTSGCEPLFLPSYKRRKKVDINNKNISFVDKNGDVWEEYNVVHPKIISWLEALGWDNIKQRLDKLSEEDLKIVIEESPWKNSTAHKLNPLDRVKMQSILQKYITSAISSTINLPKNTTEKEISNLYLTAWKLGCKGATIYVEGSRDGILISNKPTNTEDFLPLDAIKRPKELECDIFHTSVKGVPYNVVIGLYNNKPYELFATTDIFSKDKHVKATLVKVKRGHYKVIGDVNRDHLMEHMSFNEKAITRACSSLLRHRTHVKYVVDYLYKTSEENLQSFNKVVARVLKRYIKDEEVITGATCDNCGSTNLIYKDGCRSCQDCGSSACG